MSPRLRPPVMLSLAALVAVNLTPLAGVVWFGWRVFDVMFLFWLENVIIGLINVLRIAARTVLAREWSGLVLIPFFCVHYGMFCAVHGLFVVGIFHGSAGFDMRDGPPGLIGFTQGLAASNPGLLWAAAALALSHLVSFAVNFIGSGEWRQAGMKELMFAPYLRVVALHLTIIIGGGLALALGQPTAALALLVAFKIGIDIWAHLAERRRLAAQEHAAQAGAKSAAP